MTYRFEGVTEIDMAAFVRGRLQGRYGGALCVENLQDGVVISHPSDPALTVTVERTSEGWYFKNKGHTWAAWLSWWLAASLAYDFGGTVVGEDPYYPCDQNPEKWPGFESWLGQTAAKAVEVYGIDVITSTMESLPVNVRERLSYVHHIPNVLEDTVKETLPLLAPEKSAPPVRKRGRKST